MTAEKGCLVGFHDGNDESAQGRMAAAMINTCQAAMEETPGKRFVAIAIVAEVEMLPSGVSMRPQLVSFGLSKRGVRGVLGDMAEEMVDELLDAPR